MLDYSPTKTQKLLGNPDKSDNPTASSPACAGLAGEHCTLNVATMVWLVSISLHVTLRGALLVAKNAQYTKTFLNLFFIYL